MNDMPARIIELPPYLAEKIAAGEVVNRPLSVVKELMENSFDAGASAIVAEIKNGGKSYIRVTDNGSGIAGDQLEIAFKRHATSKIASVSDLSNITTMGFRGEALTSIAAVSRLELITKPRAEKAGAMLCAEGGRIIEKKDIGASDGTTVIVRDLFYNTPARLKFMKPDRTESSLIIDMVSKLALAWPEVRIRLINNGNILFSTPGKGDVMANLLTVYGRDMAEELLPLDEACEIDMRLQGLISQPDRSGTSRKRQMFFINGRVVDSKLLERSIAAAYKEMLFEGRYPAALLFLDLPPASIDVNIHPAKNEVRFENEAAVFDFVSGAARKILRTKGAIPVIKADGLIKSGAGTEEDEAAANGADTGSSPKFPAPAADLGAIRITDVNSPGAELRAGQISVKEFFSAKRKEEEGKETGDLIMEEEDSRESAGWSKRPFAIEDIRVTGAVFATFLTGVDEDSFYLIDQHAAHERVFYERLTKQHRSSEKLIQQLMTPFVIELPHAVKNDAAGLMDMVSAMGFSIEEFGPRSCVVKAIPAFIQISEARDFLDSVLGSLSGETNAENARMTERIIMDSCKKAVKAGDRLKPEEIENLLKELSRCDNPYSCPHGRPVFVRMRKHDIEKMFKRV